VCCKSYLLDIILAYLENSGIYKKILSWRELGPAQNTMMNLSELLVEWESQAKLAISYFGALLGLNRCGQALKK